MTKPTHEEDVGDGVTPSVLDGLKSGKIDLLINISDGTNIKTEVTSGYIMRRAAVDFGVSLITNMKCAIMFAEALERKHEHFPARHIQEFYELPTIGWHDK
jgi:carbamoyl-phosphate synthase/aspartate carbamoyltransferase